MVKNVLGVIPARFNSQRLPGKPLELIGDKPMIYWVAKQVEQSSLEKYVVATDDQRIFDTCLSFDIPVKMTSSECKNGTERVAEISNIFKEYKWFLNIQGDEPLIKPNSINLMLNSAKNNSSSSFIQGISTINDDNSLLDPSVVKVVVSRKGEIIYYSRLPVPFSKRSNIERYRCLGLYLYDKTFLNKYISLNSSYLEDTESIEQLRVLEAGIKIISQKLDEDGFSIDTPTDLLKIRKIFLDGNY